MGWKRSSQEKTVDSPFIIIKNVIISVESHHTDEINVNESPHKDRSMSACLDL